MEDRKEHIIQVSWDDIMEFCRGLALTLDKEYSPDLILGIAMGGVIPAAIIAMALRTDFYPIKITRRRKNLLMSSKPHLLTPLPEEISGRRVLIVDDVAVTGETILLALKEAQKKGARKVKTCAFHIQPGGFRPTYWGIESDGVVILPWNEEVIVGGTFVLHPDYEAAIREWNSRGSV
ncbi:MAG TPA: phosphoribosyltransferase [Firmicutes bacterium]|nr:phosphoribosyltransferase [Bacillota bacterium]